MWRKAFSVIIVGFLFSANAVGQETYNVHLSQAKSLITLQKYADAVTEAQKAIALDGQRWEAYVIAAKGYSSQKLFDDAIGTLQMALVRAPDDKKPLVRDAIADCRKEQNQGSTPSSPGATSAANTFPTVAASAPTQAEIVLWKSIENSSLTDDFQAYLTQYPNGAFVALAKSRIDRLKHQEEAAAKVADELHQRESEEAARQSEIKSFTIPVVHIHSVGMVGVCWGHLYLSQEGASYQGTDDNVSFAKSDVVDIDVKNTTFGGALRFKLKNGHSWAFIEVEERDVTSHKSIESRPPSSIGNLVISRWGFTWSPDNKHLIVQSK
jgi:tetratricopeptide (TPR) repeat protein